MQIAPYCGKLGEHTQSVFASIRFSQQVVGDAVPVTHLPYTCSMQSPHPTPALLPFCSVDWGLNARPFCVPGCVTLPSAGGATLAGSNHERAEHTRPSFTTTRGSRAACRMHRLVCSQHAIAAPCVACAVWSGCRPGVATVVTHDLGDPWGPSGSGSMHPRDKFAVGARLASAVRSHRVMVWRTMAVDHGLVCASPHAPRARMGCACGEATQSTRSITSNTILGRLGVPWPLGAHARADWRARCRPWC